MSRHEHVIVDPDTQQTKFDSLLERVRSEFGEEEIQTLQGTTTRWPEDMVIPSGSLSIDMATGIGGWPRGRIIELFGPESSGKTTLALHAVRSAQRQGLAVGYIDAENALDPNYMRKIGIDLGQVLIAQPAYLEMGINLMNAMMESGEVGLLVIDSIPALKAKDVIEGDAEKETRALEARRWSAQLPRVARAAKKYNTTIILINQERDSMSMYGPQTTTPGGRAIKFNASIRCQLKKYVEGRRNDGIDYQEVTADLIKNKVGPPFRKAVCYLDPPRPIDWKEDIVINSIDFDIVMKDHRLEVDGEYTSRKQWFSMELSAADLELMREDDAEAVEEKLSKEAIFPINGDTETDDEDNPLRYGLEIYQRKNFDDFIYKFPSLIEDLEERVLNRLNDDDAADILLDKNDEDSD